jgi:hypothetical protein
MQLPPRRPEGVGGLMAEQNSPSKPPGDDAGRASVIDMDSPGTFMLTLTDPTPLVVLPGLCEARITRLVVRNLTPSILETGGPVPIDPIALLPEGADAWVDLRLAPAGLRGTMINTRRIALVQRVEGW